MQELLIFWIELHLPSKHLAFLSFQIVHHMQAGTMELLLPVREGGLGIRNLRQHNTSLLMKLLWRHNFEEQTLWRWMIYVKYGNDGQWCSKMVTWLPLLFELVSGNPSGNCGPCLTISATKLEMGRKYSSGRITGLVPKL
ncbi:hypothetical protein MTR67_042684 [Solanum verrucosum]|uniref:Uncharacterized protein n=1 Tax=Solanum verrucosum TaxID=315347 RepID=A0AAF0UNU0_SOLVR|nr:hypothetical protein MTR67_042684 [Solanum verrucosum]